MPCEVIGAAKNAIKVQRGSLAVQNSLAGERSLAGIAYLDHCLLTAGSLAEQFKKRLTPARQFRFQPHGAIAVAAGPGFSTIFVATAMAGVSVLHLFKLEEFLPVRPLFGQGSAAKTNLDPLYFSVFNQPGFLHISQVLVAGDGSGAERSIFDGT